ncbi:conjugal transfer protein [Streptomyces sp. ODS28]|uniref:conjugal transfer protein n=1 Tax=Streptomyces sp. ODS28 TaxID=3136688 RepID=UPI0031EB9252
MSTKQSLSKVQCTVLALAFAPMLATGVAGGIGTYSNISAKYGEGTALGAVAAGEGATAVLALVLLGLTVLGQSSPWVIRMGLWALPAAASAMATTAAVGGGQAVIYAVTPMGMTVSAEGMAFLARRIVVHTDGHDAEAEARAATIVRELAYHRARAAAHPSKWGRKWSVRRSWWLARKAGAGDAALGERLLDVQRERVTSGADAALRDMFTTGLPTPKELPAAEEERPALPPATPEPATESKPAAAAKPAPRTAKPKTAAPSKGSKAPARLSYDEQLVKARQATARWSDEELKAEPIRTALGCGQGRSRELRDALRAERAERAEGARAEQRHLTDELDDAFAQLVTEDSASGGRHLEVAA